MTTPTRLDATDGIQPIGPPPKKKNDTHARNTTQIGTVTTAAVNATATPPSTPILIVGADLASNRSHLHTSPLLLRRNGLPRRRYHMSPPASHDRPCVFPRSNTTLAAGSRPGQIVRKTGHPLSAGLPRSRAIR